MLVESRMSGNVHVRLAGGVGETGLRQLSHHAPSEPTPADEQRADNLFSRSHSGRAEVGHFYHHFVQV
jgi:hypothetical protein